MPKDAIILPYRFVGDQRARWSRATQVWWGDDAIAGVYGPGVVPGGNEAAAPDHRGSEPSTMPHSPWARSSSSTRIAHMGYSDASESLESDVVSSGIATLGEPVENRE